LDVNLPVKGHTVMLPSDWAISGQWRPFSKMAAMLKPTKGSRADKWIMVGRPQEYSAYYVCIPPLGAVNPCLYHNRHSST